MSARSTVLTAVLALTAAIAAVRGAPAAPRDDAPSSAAPPARPAAPADAPAVSGPRAGAELIAAYWGAGMRVDHAVVVVLPDPIDSHLDWAFDAELESVRRAFEKTGYVLDRFWLPWKPSPDDAHAAPPDSLRKRWPGVMLFRRLDPDSGLAIAYLVGEVPTSGIQSVAFAAALADREAVLGAARARTEPVRVVGPTFSGSAISLRRALRTARAGRAIDSAFVVSGGATSRTTATVLRDPAGHVGFFATVTPVDALKRFVQTVLTTRLGIAPREIAYLNESGTAFGAQSARGAADLDGPLEIPFPMNISRLRKEYARDVLPADTIGRAQTSVTRLDWRDPASASESPAAVSELSAPTIERTLADIEQTLMLHDVRAVGIVATDVRDRLFLAGLVKDRLPDVQVFFVGSHSLYLRPELNAQLRGALVVSTYPLFLENQFWDLGHRGRDRLVFTSDAAEGTYNATLAQLGATDAMTDYALPLRRDAPFVAPAWITTVGASAFLPLAVRPAGDVAARDAYLLSRAAPPTRDHAEADGGALTSVVLAAALVPALALALGWSARDFRAPGAAPPTPTPTHDGPSARAWAATGEALRWQREAWTTFRCAGVLCLFTLVTLVLFRPQVHGGPASRLALYVLGGGVAGAAVTLAVRFARTRRLWSRGQWTRPRWSRGTAARAAARRPWRAYAVALAYVVLTGAFVLQVVALPPPAAGVYFVRALALGSGVTPLVPLLLGAVLAVAWGTWHLDRVTLLGDLPAFEAAAGAPGFGACHAVAESGCDNGARLAAAVGRVRRGLLRFAPERPAVGLAVALGLLGFWVATQFDRSLETVALGTLAPAARGALAWVPGTFDLLFRGVVFAAIALSTWTLFRLVVVWLALRDCLRDVEAMPLGYAFSRLPASVAHVTRLASLNAPPGAVAAVTLDRTAQERGRVLAAMPCPAYAGPALRALGAAAFRSPRLRSVGGALDAGVAPPVVALYETLCAGAGEGSVGLDMDDPRPDAERKGAPAAPQGWGDVAQELLALYVIDYLVWGARHVRQLAFSLIASLALTTVLLASYPFAPQTVVNTTFFALMAVSVAAGVVILFQVNRDATLSRIARTTPGEVDWDVHLVLNLVLIFALPVLTVLSAHFPEVRSVLFSWVAPALKAAGKG